MCWGEGIPFWKVFESHACNTKRRVYFESAESINYQELKGFLWINAFVFLKDRHSRIQPVIYGTHFNAVVESIEKADRNWRPTQYTLTN